MMLYVMLHGYVKITAFLILLIIEIKTNISLKVIKNKYLNFFDCFKHLPLVITSTTLAPFATTLL